MKTKTNIGRNAFLLAALIGLSACAQQPAATAEAVAPVRYAAPASVGSSQPVLSSLPPASRIGTVDMTDSNSDMIVDGGPEVVKVSKRLNCVQFARARSGLKVSGNAGTWWDHAKGKYARSHDPIPGSVMVFSSTKRMRSGHVAVVRQVVSNREVRIDHANWTNDGHMHLNASVIDVSPNNDWSQVRVWNTRGGSMGTRVYPLKGFVLPQTAVATLDDDTVLR